MYQKNTGFASTSESIPPHQLTLDVDFEIQRLVFQRLSDALVQTRIGSHDGVNCLLGVCASIDSNVASLGWCRSRRRCYHVLPLVLAEGNLDPGSAVVARLG